MAKSKNKADYIAAITAASAALDLAKREYSEYVTAHPEDTDRQASLNEIRMQQLKQQKGKSNAVIVKEAEDFNAKIAVENSTKVAIAAAKK